MEYCDRLECGGLYSKRKMQAARGFLAAAVLAGTIGEFSELKMEGPFFSYENEYDRAADVGRIPAVGSIMSYEEEIPDIGSTDTDILQKSLGERIVQYGDEGKRLTTFAFGIPTIPEVSTYGQTLPTPESLPVPSTPQTPELEDSWVVPGRPSMPNVPPSNGEVSLPENIIPSIPQEVVPDKTTEQERPDISEEEQIPVVDQMQGFLVDDAGMIYGYDPSANMAFAGGLTLPSEGCTGIAKGAFEGVGAGIYEIYIPANITYIEPGALEGLSDLGWIELMEQNPKYECFEGILYDSTMTAIVAFPPARTGQYAIPGFTTKLEDYSFAGTQLSKLDMRSCGLMEVGQKVFGESKVNGVAATAPRQYIEEYRVAFDGTGVLVE